MSTECKEQGCRVCMMHCRQDLSGLKTELTQNGVQGNKKTTFGAKKSLSWKGILEAVNNS